MHSLWRELQSRIRYKIILPFLVLMLLVGIAGSGIAIWSAVADAQRDLENLVADVNRSANSAIVEQELVNLEYLRQIVFAPQNPQTGAPAVQEGFEKNNALGLRVALEPYMLLGIRDTNVSIDRLIAVNEIGRTLIDLERFPITSTSTFITVDPPPDLSAEPAVEQLLAGEEDALGDKLAEFLVLPTHDGESASYFVTMTPLYERSEAPPGPVASDPVEPDSAVTGGLLLAMRVERLLNNLAARSEADLLVIYDLEGNALFGQQDDDSITSAARLNTLDINDAVLSQLPNPSDQERGASTTTIEERTDTVMDSRNLGEVPYQLAFTPLTIRDKQVGYIAAGLNSTFVLNTGTTLQQFVILVTIALVAGIVGAGTIATRMITRPLKELVDTTKAVVDGDLQRRSRVSARDEVGMLSRSFNLMTNHLIQLYAQVRRESSRRAAIVESIADGIIVSDTEGQVHIVNRSMRRMLGLQDTDTPPAHISELPMVPYTGKAFDQEQADSYYQIGEAGTTIVRQSEDPVIDSQGDDLGERVFVLRDMTAEVRVDQAKTNFIGTISHEFRTPLTIMQGTTDLLLRQAFGQLEPQQRDELDGMRRQLVNLMSRVNNAIEIADIDAGRLVLEPEELDVAETVEEAVWNWKRKAHPAPKASGLDITQDIPDDMPLVVADYNQFFSIVRHLIDNAWKYTEEGEIVVRASHSATHVQIDICDTGTGIEPDQQDRIFESFVRGTGRGQGIDSQERGIGLGLTIARRLIEANGGQIWVSSEVGTGSVFSFVLHQAPQAPQEATPPTISSTA